MDDDDLHVLCLIRENDERYIFLFRSVDRDEAQRQLGRFAARPDLSFSWYDAACVSQRIRELVPPE